MYVKKDYEYGLTFMDANVDVMQAACVPFSEKYLLINT